ncbi:MAG: NADH-quinone oxidoreductase subunit G [Campylobacterales bacterium]|nr:NADH-quinone oxidoreductase subunit G [Campylobacterales bacterium]
METLITVTIDGTEIKTKEGEYILNIARANGIFIPAICYLTRCSPTLACRLCLIDIDGKRAYACNAKAKDGMKVTTITDEIAVERRAIMEVYDINHPLQCGVCDQSGECELQNYTLEMEVNTQNYSIKDTQKQKQTWSNFISYDPSLCIVCERCVTVCKDMIGESALKTVKRGGEEIDVTFKESMPKDSYAMWNKLNKSLIGANNGDTLDCSMCGECISVCPVGAIVSSDFKYKSNAWELRSIPATCAHCSSGCQIFYDVKHDSIDNFETEKIYRVKNEWNYVSLCGAGRFGYDFENRAKKDKTAFDRAIEAFKKAKSIKFSSYITNEEALILQKLKEKYGYKLINEDGYRFKNFMNEYSKVSGTLFNTTTTKDIHDSNFVISIGSAIRYDAPNISYALNNSLKINKGSAIYFHPIKDTIVESFSKNIQEININCYSEEALLLFLIDKFANKEKLPSDLVEFLNSQKEKITKSVTEIIKEDVIEKVVDENGVEKEVKKSVPKKIVKDVEVEISKLYDVIGIDDSINSIIENLIAKKDSFSLIIGEDIISSENYKNLAKLVALFEKSTQFKVLIIPTKTNTLGVSLICDLDEKAEGFTIGYNCDGDFKLSALGDGDLDIPALNQQEGTFVNIDKRVVPTNVAIEFDGYCLNDIALTLGISKNRYTIDYTKELPLVTGFQHINFDKLKNMYDNNGNEIRGYSLIQIETNIDEFVFNKPNLNIQKDKITAYRCNPYTQFSYFTNKTTQLKAKASIKLTKSLAKEYELENGSLLKVVFSDGSLELPVEIDDKLDGNFVLIPDFDKNVSVNHYFKNGRYSPITLNKVNA